MSGKESIRPNQKRGAGKPRLSKPHAQFGDRFRPLVTNRQIGYVEEGRAVAHYFLERGRQRGRAGSPERRNCLVLLVPIGRGGRFAKIVSLRGFNRVDSSGELFGQGIEKTRLVDAMRPNLLHGVVDESCPRYGRRGQ